MPGETHFFEDIYSMEATGNINFSEKDRNYIIERLLSLYYRYNEPSDQKRVDRLCRRKEFKNTLLSAPASCQSIIKSQKFYQRWSLCPAGKTKGAACAGFSRGWGHEFAELVEKRLLWFFKKTFGRADAFIVLASEFEQKLQRWGITAPPFIGAVRLLIITFCLILI